MRNIIFLDFDGVLNCEVFYKTQQFADYKEAKKQLRKEVKDEKIDRLDYYAGQICKDRIQLLNTLCHATESKIVISSTWRLGKSVEELQEVLNYCGATCTVIDKTGSCECRNRGCEIHRWIVDHSQKYFDIPYHEFHRYAIIDDDSDMLLGQASNFFQTDCYSGLTPNIVYKITKFLNRK